MSTTADIFRKAPGQIPSGKTPTEKTPTEQRRPSILLTAFLGVFAAIWLFPFLWTFLSALKTPSEISAGVWSLPRSLSWGNFARAFESLRYLHTLRNSLIVAVSTAALQCATGSLAGFAFARMRFPGRDLIFTLFVATLMIPTTVTLTANYLILSSLGWLDTFLALIIPQGASGFSIFLMRQFFKTIPNELEDAARIDGAGRIRFLRSIAVPLAKPALSTVFVFIFITNYNEFLWPLIMTNSESIRVIQIQMDRLTGEFGVLDYGALMSASILVLAPTIVMFVLLQRAFIRGITKTGFQ